MEAWKSKKITLIHPVARKSMSWKVEPPNDMKELINCLNTFDS